MSPFYSRNRSGKKQSPISLNHGLDHKLMSYAAAASAAGVGMMALAQPSHAEVIYTATNQTVSANQTVAIDLNHDGITDFTVSNRFYTISARGDAFPTGGGGLRLAGELRIIPGTLNRVLIDANYDASALPAGRKVGPRGDFIGGARYMQYCISSTGGTGYRRTGGQWNDVKNRYLGLQLSVNGQVHFGWARLNVSHAKGSCEMTAVLTGYAYETVAGKPIGAGQTSDVASGDEAKSMSAILGALALGTGGLGIWRRDDETTGSKN